MKRSLFDSSKIHGPPANSRYYYFSDQGEVVYAPAGEGTSPSRLADSFDNARLPGPSSSSSSYDRSSAIQSVTPTAEELTSRTHEPSELKTTLEYAPRLGLPKDWVIYPLSRRSHRGATLHRASSPFHRAFHLSRSGARERVSGDGSTASDFRDIDPCRIDYSRPLSFEISTKFATPPPSYRSRRSCSSLPPYSGTPPVLPQPDLGEIFRVPTHDFNSQTVGESRHNDPPVVPAIHITDDENTLPSTPDLPQKPRLKHSRDLPREFTEQELHQIRRNTRHCIRVVTRTSIGLTASIALSVVAPQLLIAAAINAYCLGRGAHRLHQQLEFLKTNELKVRKRDSKLSLTPFVQAKRRIGTDFLEVVLAVTEGVAIKVAFMAITINLDDFIVLTHELAGMPVSPIVEFLQAHPIPGIHALNDFFLKPVENAEGQLGLPTMADRATIIRHLSDGSNLGTLFGVGGWGSSDVSMLVKNVFLIGGVQAGMEHATDEVQDRIGKVIDTLKRKLGFQREQSRMHRKDHALKMTEDEINAMGKDVHHNGVGGHRQGNCESTTKIDLSVLLERAEKNSVDEKPAPRRVSLPTLGKSRERICCEHVQFSQRSK